MAEALGALLFAASLAWAAGPADLEAFRERTAVSVGLDKSARGKVNSGGERILQAMGAHVSWFY